MLTAVMGAVGPEIWVGVPPKKAAKKLTKMAPYSPAVGPRPELTPKARAKGRATIPAVSPPKKSPRKCEKSKEKRVFIAKLTRVVLMTLKGFKKTRIWKQPYRGR